MKSGLREQYVAFLKEFDDAMVKGDAVAAAALFTEDACFVDPTAGLIYGRKAIKKFFSDGFKKIPFISHVSTPDQHSPHVLDTAGDKVWTSGQWNVTLQAPDGAPVQMKGYWLDVDVRKGNRWKILVSYHAPVAPPLPAPAQTKKRR
jgi:ketosteroid isomerase-like protein